jgi:dTDP-glucose 4,6-dehydratase
VEDHAKALTLVLERGRVSESYNIGGRNERATLFLCRAIDLRFAGPSVAFSSRFTWRVDFVLTPIGHDMIGVMPLMR